MEVQRISVRVTPRATRDEVVGWDRARGALQVRVTATPADNAANGALIRLLAKTYRVPKSSVRIVKGAKSRDKTVEISRRRPARAPSRA